MVEKISIFLWEIWEDLEKGRMVKNGDGCVFGRSGQAFGKIIGAGKYEWMQGRNDPEHEYEALCMHLPK